jgi:Cof subfamily protein (haloacid dehalogenase superfamily)
VTAASNIALLISDVDGTLLTTDKVLTQRTRTAARSLDATGIKLAITSGRPPAGMAFLSDALHLETPVTGFNGGTFVDPHDGRILATHLLEPTAARRAIDIVLANGLDAWVFTESRWMIRDPEAPQVAREQRTLGMQPTVIAAFDPELGHAAKIVGVGEDYARVERCESEVRETLAGAATAVRSQPYYLDITHPQANKGAVLDFLSARLDVPAGQTATIGDGFNDVLMFHKSGLSIAMGNASDDVKVEASRVTASCDRDGFADAVACFILPTQGTS